MVRQGAVSLPAASFLPRMGSTKKPGPLPIGRLEISGNGRSGGWEANFSELAWAKRSGPIAAKMHVASSHEWRFIVSPQVVGAQTVTRVPRVLVRSRARALRCSNFDLPSAWRSVAQHT